MHHDDTVRRELHVQFQALRTGLPASIERGERVFGAERGAASVREHQRTRMIEETQPRLRYPSSK
jgi:hypothetical protein